MNFSSIKYFTFILTTLLSHFALTKDICQDQKAFSCDYTQIEGISQSDGFGQMQAIEFAQAVSSESTCPFYLMNQYVKDCEEGYLTADSTQNNFNKKCSKKVRNPYNSVRVLEQALQSYTSKDIPPLGDCLKKPFPTNGAVGKYINPLKTIPKEKQKDFVAEYYTAAQRLLERSRSEFQTIAYINQLVGFEDSPSCDHAATDDILEECKKLNECGSERDEKGLIELAKKSIIALKLKKELDEYNKACERQIGHTGVSIPQYAKKCNEKVEYKGKIINKRKLLQSAHNFNKQIYPWIESTEFQDENEDFDLMKKLDKLGDKSIPKHITKEVAQNIEIQMKHSREKIAESAKQTKNHFDCLTKNRYCDQIDGGLFDFDNRFFENDTLTRTSTRMYKLQKMIASSPEIDKKLPPKLRPYVKQAQCRQDARIETEDKKQLMAAVATDGTLFLATVVAAFTTYGAATPAATATGARLGLTLGRALKIAIHQPVTKIFGTGSLVAMPVLIDEAVDECTDNKHKLDYKQPSSSKNICQNLKANITHTTDLTGCIQMSIAAFLLPNIRVRVRTKFYRGILEEVRAKQAIEKAIKKSK